MSRRVRRWFAALLAVVVPAVVLVVPEPVAASTVFTFTGGGYGHGVGMSQWGAKGRADAGQSAATILAAYYAGTSISPMSLGPVRVKLTDAPSTTLIQPGGTIRFATGAAPPSVGLGAGEIATVWAEGNRVLVARTAPTRGDTFVLAEAGQSAVITFDQGTPLTMGAFGGRRHLWGRFVVRALTAGSLEIVAELPMEQYLRGLAEVPSSWPTEALRAQAIAGRTFAAYRLGRPQSPRFDLYATVTDQAYTGSEVELRGGSRWIDAVNDTAGLVITSGGEPIQAFYSSSNGGSSEASEYVFVSALSYLRPVADPWDQAVGNANFSWTRTYSGAELGAWLAAAGRGDVGEVQAIEVRSGVGVSGRVDKATIEVRGTAGTITVTGAQLRAAINARVPFARSLLSTKFSISGGVPVGVAPGGRLDLALGWGDAALVVGWAVDADVPADPIDVHLYVNGVFAASVTANWARADVGAVMPWFGPNHGFATFVRAPGKSVVCAYAIDVAGPGRNTGLGCQTVVRPPPPKPKPKAKARVRTRPRR
jgi:SpoIID/LytB domain protein